MAAASRRRLPRPPGASGGTPEPRCGATLRLRLASLFFLLAPLCPAVDPPDLAELRASFHRDLAGAIGSAARGFERRLQDLEREAAARGDYLSAQVARERAVALRRRLDSLAGGSPGGVTLKAAEASATGGSVVYDAATRTLQRWMKPGNSATWETRVPSPGRYRVCLVYAAAPREPNPDASGSGSPAYLESGGSISFREETGLRREAAVALGATLVETGGWQKFSEAEIGVIALESSSATLVLEATAAGTLGLMHLREVRLYPDDGATAPGPDGDPPALAALRSAHQERVRELLGPVIDRFSAQLEAVGQSQLSPGNLAAEELRQELASALPPVAEAPVPAGAPATGPGDPPPPPWRVITAATLDTGAADNRADTFWLLTADGRLWVRLFGCDSPHPAYEDDSALAEEAVAFGIDGEDLLRVGREALRFTTATLTESPFTVFTRGQADDYGRTLAFITTPRGLLAEELVGRGLALAGGRSSDLPGQVKPGTDAAGMEALIASAQDRAARARRGLWRYRDDG